MKILDFLVPGSVALHYAAADSKDVIAHLGKLLFEAGYVRETFVEAALDRESRLPTGLPLSGDVNAAIPHTEVEHVRKSGLAMATSHRVRPVLETGSMALRASRVCMHRVAPSSGPVSPRRCAHSLG